MPGTKTHKKLVRAGAEHAFWVHNGPVLSSLRDLHHALVHEMDDDQFRYHVSKGKNDFIPWVKDVLMDAACARSLARVRTRQTAASKVADCLETYR